MKPEGRNVEPVVLYGVGSPLVVDVQESCVRAGIPIAACVKNFDGPSFLAFDAQTITVAQIGRDLLKAGILLPMFSPGNRVLAWDEAQRAGFEGAGTLLDPTAVVASSAAISRGVYVNAGVVIGGGVTLEEFALVNRAASVGHHSRLGPYCSIGPGAIIAGSVNVGRCAVVGAGAVVGPKISIGEGAVVGTGAVVLRDVPPGTVVLGNPARVVRSLADPTAD